MQSWLVVHFNSFIIFINKGEIIMYKLIMDNADNGIAIMVDDFQNMTAYVNGKHYSVRSYRPISGNGRQLREDSQKAIRDMLPRAKARLEEIQAAEAAAQEAAKLEAMEAARREVTPVPRTFAEVLEESFIKTLTEKSAEDMVKQMYPTVEKMLTEKFGLLPQIHEIHIPGQEKRELQGIMHKDFDIIVSMVSDNESIYLCGPAGTGKSYLAKQVADALGLEYWYTASVVDDIQLKGFIDANGRYHETQFYNAFTKGGIFLLDELDASVPETLVLLNNALANGYFDFPTGRTTAHKDFHAIAAGNTFGTGADSTYTGRYVLDAASMDRFALIKVDYDRRIEEAMAAGDMELVDFANDFRKAVANVGTTCLCTYRAIKRLAKFSKYMTKAEALQIGLVKGLSPDDVRTIYQNMTVNNDWKTALSKLF